MGQEFQILGFNMFLISSFIFKYMIYFRLKKLTANGFFFSFLHPSNHVVMSKFITEKQPELQVTQVCLKFREHDHTHKI